MPWSSWVATAWTLVRRRFAHAWRPIRTRPLRSDIVVDRDVTIVVRDTRTLRASLYRPASPGRVPTIVSCSPYGKDDFRGKQSGYHSLWFRAGILLYGLDFGDIEVSEGTSFEAPDPAYWVPRGYAVLHYDTRGSHRSEGNMDLFSQKDREDLYDVIEWAAAQAWCTGNVGTCGVSYLAISQWYAASLAPPHLKAMIPWEGVSDLYRDCMYHGGIPETGFGLFYFFSSMLAVWNWRYRPATNPLRLLRPEEHFDAFWELRAAELEKITVPALICASWSDHGLHTRGSFEAHRRISSQHKYLFNHGRKKWEVFYSPEALRWQGRFFDHFLKDDAAAPLGLPKVRFEVRTQGQAHEVRYADEFPVAGTEYRKLYLDGARGDLTAKPPAAAHVEKYAARRGCARFTHTFAADTLLVGNMMLQLWVSAAGRDDLDLFVGIKKLGADGREVHFEGNAGHQRNIVTKGWLRVSHRTTDPARSLPERPFHSHDNVQKLSPGEVAEVQIEILPSGTRFERGSTLELVIAGHDLVSHPVEHHMVTVNRGTHELHTGGACASYLLIPDATAALSKRDGID
jgi:hypothetical protein